MAIVQTLSKSSFIDAFKQSSRKDQFSYEALCAIFDYLEDYSEDTGEDVELDIIAICCEWAEDTWQGIAMAYDVDLSCCADDDERKGEVEDYLCRNTQYVEVDDGVFVYVQF
jgi:hypothetical protein